MQFMIHIRITIVISNMNNKIKFVIRKMYYILKKYVMHRNIKHNH